MNALRNFNKKMFPLLGIGMLIPIVPLWYWITAHDEMHFPPMDLAVYRRAADFAVAGISPYGAEFTNISGTYLPWVYTPFGTLVISPLHYVPENYLLEFWSVFAILLPTIILVILGYQAFLSGNLNGKTEKIFAVIIFSILGLSTGPVLDAWALGQIGVILCALTLFDLSAPEAWFKFKKIKFPRGILAGIAGAIKLVPLIVLPFWIVTKQWRAAATASLTLAFAWLLAFFVMPDDSRTYFKNKLFLGTNGLDNIATSDNQSLIGTLMRIKGIHPLPNSTWIPASILIVVLGLLLARDSFRNNHVLSAGIIVGLTSALASPISWIHHIAWLVAVPGALLDKNSFRTTTSRISIKGWAWYISILVIALPPVRYVWSPLFKANIKEHYSILAVVCILVLWWHSRRKPQRNEIR